MQQLSQQFSPVNKEEQENRETVSDKPNVLAFLYTKERRHTRRITGYADNVVVVRNIIEKNLVLLSGRMKLAAMFSPVETYLNPQRSSRRPPSWIFIRNIPFILPLGAENIPFTLPLGAEWME